MTNKILYALYLSIFCVGLIVSLYEPPIFIIALCVTSAVLAIQYLVKLARNFLTTKGYNND